MSKFKPTRAQRRQLKKLGEVVDRVTQGDRLFFERFPHRKHRVRLTSAAEIEQQEIFVGSPVWLPPECRLFTIVRNIAPGVRLRVYFRGPANGETDVTEDVARSIFEAASTPQTSEIEAQMRRAVEVRK